MKLETKAVHAGRTVDAATGAITPAIHLSTTFERSPSGGYPTGFSYSREGNPNRLALEQCLASLEGGTEALVFGSGMAVLNAVLQGLEPGDHIIAPDDVYYALRVLIRDVLPKAGLEITYVDMADAGCIEAAVRPNTGLCGWRRLPIRCCASRTWRRRRRSRGGPTQSVSATARLRRRCCNGRSTRVSTW